MWLIPATHLKTVSQSDRITVFTKPHESQTIIGEPCRRQLLPARFSGDLHSGGRAHQQERLLPIYLPMEASLENTIIHSHSPISSSAREFMGRRVTACVTLFLHAPPLAGASAADKPIHSLHTPRRRWKSPSFSVFLSGHCYFVFLSPESPLFLCFLELYDIFRTLGVVYVDSY